MDKPLLNLDLIVKVESVSVALSVLPFDNLGPKDHDRLELHVDTVVI